MPWPIENDDELFAIIERERERLNTTVQLIASENFASPAVMRATGSVLTNKYSEGYPGKRYYGGNRFIDQAEELARERVKGLFGAEHANVQSHSGASYHSTQAARCENLKDDQKNVSRSLSFRAAVTYPKCDSRET